MTIGVAEQLTETVTLHCGDCLDVLKTLEANSVDACVTDPPYHLTSYNRYAGGAAPSHVAGGKSKGNAPFKTACSGFMGKQWDGGDIAFRSDVWREVLRVLKPGAHLLSFGGTRTYHRMACAIEDAGFEIRDCVQWLYGSGFPKSLDISKQIDKAAGAEREVVGIGGFAARRIQNKPRPNTANVDGYVNPETSAQITIPATAAARQWSGFGTALKPACELIVLARKPLSEKTVAANVLKWGTGALNIDGCRVEAEARTVPVGERINGNKVYGEGLQGDHHRREPTSNSRWPANVIHDGSDEVVAGFPDAPEQQRGVGPEHEAKPSINVYCDYGPRDQFEPRNDSDSSARFFYSAKADADDRLGSKHPTVKPVDLKQYLVRLITPPGGRVLDCFAGTGTTGEAAWREGMRAVLIEREAEYQEDIRRRMRLAMVSARERCHESIKAKQKDKPLDLGPLFQELTK